MKDRPNQIKFIFDRSWTLSLNTLGEYFVLYRPHCSTFIGKKDWYCEIHSGAPELKKYDFWSEERRDEFRTLWKRDIAPQHTTLGKIVFAMELREK